MIEADPFTIGLWATVVVGSYHFLDYIFPRLTDRFRSLKPASRRRYVIKNLLKSALLLFLGIAATPGMYRFFYQNNPDNEWIHTVGVLYAIPDVYALWWVRGMLYQSTIYHHLSVGVLATVGLFLDHNIDTHWIAMLVYAYISMWTGVVNLYLGARFLLKRNDKDEDRWRQRLACVALSIYAGCCLVNWTYQLHTVMKWLDWRWGDLSWENFVGLIAYCAMMFFIVKDDLILMRKLRNECSPYLPPATIEEQRDHFISTLYEQTDENWPLILGKSCGSLGKEQLTVSTVYPGPIGISSITHKARHFRTPYDVEITSHYALLVFTLCERARKPKE